MEEKQPVNKDKENEVVLDLPDVEESEEKRDPVETEDSIEDEVKILEEKLLRLQAEFDNYRKRMDTRFSELAKYAAESILLKVLDVYDNIERALQVDFEINPIAAKKGIEGIEQQFSKIMSQEDVKKIESLKKPFDPYYHNSINTKNDPTAEDGIILEVYQHGYMLKDRVLRPAIVCVNRHEAQADDGQSDDKEENMER